MTISDDVRAVVTGAGSGLGRAIAVELAARGARVLVADIDEAGGHETVRQLRDAGARAHFHPCDVRSAEQVEALADLADEHFGGADMIVNNAGVAVSGRVGEVPLDDWRFVVDVNLYGVLHGCHTFVPRFLARGRGYVLNVASAAGLLNPPELGPYNVTKAGVIALSETLRAEVADHGVRVTVLCPTFFQTNLMSTARGPEQHKSAAAKLMGRAKVGASDVARAALRALDEDRLYAVPMLDGRALWRLKRATPGGYAGVLAWVMKKGFLPA